MVIMAPMSERPQSSPVGTSLWTTPASPAALPLKQAAIDTSVSAAKLREAVDAARDRAAAFSGRVTEELLRKSF
jgi:hypothetical protein